jgi:hypothetical protein
VPHRSEVLFPFSKDLFEGLRLDAAACFDVDVQLFIIVESKAFGFTLIRGFCRDSLIASRVWNTDTNLPDRIFEVIPFVENDPPVTPQINPNITVFSRRLPYFDSLSLIRKLAD